MESIPQFVRTTHNCYVAINHIVAVTIPSDVDTTPVALYTDEHEGAFYTVSAAYNRSVLATLNIDIPITPNEEA